jgi:hypothetical protein
MSARRPSGYWRHWLGLFFLGGATNMMPQNQLAPEDVRWTKWRINEVKIGVEVEGDQEKRTVVNTTQSVNQESFYAIPIMGLDLLGSVYHPNLLQINANVEGGIGWEKNSTDIPDGGTRNDNPYLLRYHLSGDILKEKPYAASVFAEKEHTTRDYDFFTRATVDQESQGARVGFTEGPVPFSLAFRHVVEDVTGQTRPMSLDEDVLTFTAYHERSEGNRTDFSYTLDDYTRLESGSYNQTGTQHLISLNDNKAFGARNWVKLNSSLMYNQLETGTTPFDQTTTTDRFNRYFTDHEHLNWRHTSQLQSDYNYSYNNQDSGSSSSDGHSASAALRHQLYESLTSAFDVHGQTYSSSGGGASLDTRRYGIGLNENYTKRLANWGRLTFGYSGLLDHETQTSTGLILSIVGENHVLSDAVITYLNQPQVLLSTIQVWDASGNVLYRELLDYQVISHGTQVEIKRVVGGLIPDGSTVRVDYSAVSQPSDSYSTSDNQFQLRLDFFDGLVGIYGRLNLQDNYGGESLVLENINDQVVGADLTWRWLRAGAEYEVYDSNLSPYRATRLFQTINYEALANTLLSLDLGQNWTTFPEPNRDLTTYHAIARIRTQVTPALAVNVEGGIRFQRGQGYDQDLGTGRAHLEYKYGKLKVQTGYEYENETYIGSLRVRNFFFFRAKRSF